MTETAFTLLEDRDIPEVASTAKYYRHNRTGAEVLSLINSDENKTFGVAFATPPSDSTGVAHILEHSVLCGSKNYPLRKPFIAMARGSLQTFMNAMTFPDKTVYPVASQNLQDFYNLVSLYIDAVFNPLLTEDTFLQEGWHFEAETPDATPIYKGVVFNEMKGAYSTPDRVLGDAIQNALLPDTIYAHSSGGDPRAIPDLTFEDFRDFHRRFYHPANARIVFYGDDDPAERLRLIDDALAAFDPEPAAGEIALQPKITTPVKVEETYPANPDQGPARDGRLTVSWLLDEMPDYDTSLAVAILVLVLAGTPASPMRRTLTESGLGEQMIGQNHTPGRQPIITFGLRGIDPANAEKVEALVLSELERLAAEGLPDKAVEAAINTLEFQLRELNTGQLPRGLALAFSSFSRWLHGHDPIEPLAFAAPLARVKDQIASNPDFLPDLIRTELLDNPHRATVTLKADFGLAAQRAAEERDRLEMQWAQMDEAERKEIVRKTQDLKKLQAAPEDPAALATLPSLNLSDLPKADTPIPTEFLEVAGTETLYHDLPTNGIVYLDLGFNLDAVPDAHLPFLPLFTRALTQTGAGDDDFAGLIQRIGRTTGGVSARSQFLPRLGQADAAAHVFISGKATPDHTQDLIDLVADITGKVRLDDKERLRQMIREMKAGLENQLAPGGHQLAISRMQAGLNQTGALGEITGGVSQLFFLRDLEKRLDEDWDSIRQTLFDMRDAIFRQGGTIANVTAREKDWQALEPELAGLIGNLPDRSAVTFARSPLDLPAQEGLTFPAQVNYVAAGFNLSSVGYKPSGAANVAVQYLNTTHLWDKIRVEGGAYGGFCGYNGLSGNFSFGSYRDPSLLQTLETYEATPTFLRQPIDPANLVRPIIGVIGGIDTYRLPDAKGFAALTWHMTGQTEAWRQTRREEVLGTTAADFKILAAALEAAQKEARIVVLGSEEQIAAANAERGDFLAVSKIM